MRGLLGQWSRVAGWGAAAMVVVTLLAVPAALAHPTDEPCAPLCEEKPQPSPSATGREEPEPDPSPDPSSPPATSKPPEPTASPAPRPTTSDRPRPTNPGPIEAPPVLPPVEAPPLPTLSPPLPTLSPPLPTLSPPMPTLSPTVTSPTPFDPGTEPPSSRGPSSAPTWTRPAPLPPSEPVPSVSTRHTSGTVAENPPETSGQSPTGSAQLSPGMPSDPPLPGPQGPGGGPEKQPAFESLALERGLSAMLPMMAGSIIVMGLTLLLRPPRPPI